jgi:chromosomal replication initiation ATPase DnaA
LFLNNNTGTGVTGMKQQLFFDLAGTEESGALLPSDCNRTALDYLARWPDWEAAGAILYGAESSGKSHLLNLWAAQTGAVLLTPAILRKEELLTAAPNSSRCFALDNADIVLQGADCAKALFHLYNIHNAEKGRFLLTATTDIAGWDCPLPDLLSRLKTFAAVNLLPPDDSLLKTLFVKYFSDRQTKISAEVTEYVLKRTERNCSAVQSLAAALDTAALAQKRPVSIPLAREILDEGKKTIELPL